MSLDSKIALVTGGGRGIGAACARRLAAEGASIVVTGRTQSEIDAVAAEVDGLAVRADFTDRGSIDALVETVRAERGRVDILVNNAGIAASEKLERITDDLWDRILEVNATAPFRLIRALVPAMVEAGWGRVVNIASNAGVSGYRYSSAYCASKHAVVGMTRALAIDLAPTGVTINSVCPGWVDTNMVTEATERIASKTGASASDAKAALARMSPQNRMLQPEEVANVVAMLCGEQARGIHGQALVIDGGQVLK